ncbi:hypothetical protein M9H77_11753 [Catharanthus roseus]|uniref:Uncharacterized protein n=1 Tax=Catharanthus roseus TaxID=4058 RepID=A0ACC0BFE6_CATRO|nr:hypothetical protein M9H77_11753 [Catharanthus roseus]
MTWKAQGIVELLQGPVTGAMARRVEEERLGKIAEFKKMIQDLSWQVIGDQEEDFERSKTVLWSSVQVEESKEANLGNLGASKNQKNDFFGPTANGRSILISTVRFWQRKDWKYLTYHGGSTRAMASRMEKEYRGKIAEFKKMIQDLAWQVIGDQEEDFKSRSVVLSMVGFWQRKDWRYLTYRGGSNRGEYVRYHEVVSTVVIIKKEMLTVESTIMVPTSLQENKMALVTSLLVLDPLSILLIIAMREIELRRKMNGRVRWNTKPYNVDEDDKAILASCSFSPSILEYILACRKEEMSGVQYLERAKGCLEQ